MFLLLIFKCLLCVAGGLRACVNYGYVSNPVKDFKTVKDFFLNLQILMTGNMRAKRVKLFVNIRFLNETLNVYLVGHKTHLPWHYFEISGA